MPGLQYGLVRAAHEPLRQVRVGDDVAAAGERLVPGGAVQHDGPRGRRRGSLPVPDHPQVLQPVRRAAAQQFLVDGARRVPVRPPVEGAVQHRLAARQAAGAGVVALAQHPLPVRAALRLRHRGPGVEEQPVVEAAVDGEGLAARLRRHRQRLEDPGRDPYRRFRAGPVAQEQVPAAGGQRDGAGEGLQRAGAQGGGEPAPLVRARPLLRWIRQRRDGAGRRREAGPPSRYAVGLDGDGVLHAVGAVPQHQFGRAGRRAGGEAPRHDQGALGGPADGVRHRLRGAVAQHQLPRRLRLDEQPPRRPPRRGSVPRS